MTLTQALSAKGRSSLWILFVSTDTICSSLIGYYLLDCRATHESLRRRGAAYTLLRFSYFVTFLITLAKYPERRNLRDDRFYGGRGR